MVGLGALAAGPLPSQETSRDTSTRAAPRPDSAAPEAQPDARPDECFGFAFGPWDPPLDWAAAKHPPLRGGVRTLPPGARGDASRAGIPGDSTLLLFPPWWPAGVLVRFTTDPASSDTLRGIATALVADGRVRAPTSRVVGQRVPCGASPERSGQVRQDSSQG